MRRLLLVSAVLAGAALFLPGTAAADNGPHTVQTHRQNIMRKLNLHSRTELIKYALRHGLTE